MNILPSGGSHTFTLPANNTLTVTSRGGTTVTGPSGLLGTVDGTSTFGGYSVDTVITIAAVMNDCQYGVTEPENALLSTDANNNTVLVGADEVLSFGANFLPRIQNVHDLTLAEPLHMLDLPTPYGVGTANSDGLYEFAYGTPVHCARGFNGYKFWMVAAPYPTGGTDLGGMLANKYENPCILASNDGENFVVPTGMINPIVTSIGLADANSYYADPYIAFNEDYSKLYVIFMHTNQSGTVKSSLLVTESSDGVTWTTPVSIFDSTSTGMTANSPSLFRTETGWTCLVIDTLAGSGTFLPKIMTTTSSTPYSGWSAFSTSTWTHPLSRNWWHSHFIPLADGGIIGMAVDNGSAGGSCYTLQSNDGGVTFSAQPFTAWNPSSAGGTWYRPSLCICSDGVNQSIKGYFSRIGPLQATGFYIQKANLQNGGNVLDSVLFSMVAGQTVQNNGALSAWDSFNRTDNATALGTSDGGHVWTNDTGTMGIGTNRAYNTTAAGGNSIATIDPKLKSYEFSTKIETINDSFFLSFNGVDTSNRYRFGGTTSALKFQKIVAGSVTVDKTISIVSASGDSFGVRVQGKYITLLHNGRVIDTYYDASLISGTKIGLQASSVTPAYFEQIMVKPL
jgi:hypothetical protein